MIVPLRTGIAPYAAFSTAWSLLFFLVGAAGGVQQEVTRATTTPSAVSGVQRPARPAVFGVLAGVLAAVMIAVSGLWWGPALFPAAGPSGAIAIGLGVGCYVGVAVVAGLLYGAASWVPVAALIAADGVLRIAGVILVLVIGAAGPALIWAIVAPFPIVLAVAVPVLQRSLTRPRLDVTTAGLTWNTARLVIAAAATAALVSGIPFLVRVAIPGLPAADFAPVALALTITRAPIVIPLLALQSYLIVRFSANRSFRGPAALAGGVLVLGVLLALLCAAVGPAVIGAVFGASYRIQALPLGLIVASSGVLAALSVLGAAAVAHRRHGAATAAWIVAAVATVIGLLLRLPTDLRIGLALVGGAVLGLIVLVIVVAAAVASERGTATGRVPATEPATEPASVPEDRR